MNKLTILFGYLIHEYLKNLKNNIILRKIRQKSGKPMSVCSDRVYNKKGWDTIWNSFK